VKCGDGTAASGHQRKHLITGEIEVVGARLELKELEQGRISTRRRRPASTRRGRGMKWRGDLVRVRPHGGRSGGSDAVCGARLEEGWASD
jgi:hypothetical protein